MSGSRGEGSASWGIPEFPSTAVATCESSGHHVEPRLVEAFLGMLPKVLQTKAEWDEREQKQEYG